MTHGTLVGLGELAPPPPPATNPTLVSQEHHTFTTQSGRKFDLANPTADMVDPEDIAHALAHICRYGGHVPQHYSVAQHSVYVCYAVAEEVGLSPYEVDAGAVGGYRALLALALLHDAPEAYVGDCISPLKSLVGAAYQDVEAKVWAAVADRFKLPMAWPEGYAAVDRADKRLFAAESVQLRGRTKDDFGKLVNPELFEQRWMGTIEQWSAASARTSFRDLLYKLV